MAGQIDFTTFKNVINGRLTSTETTRHGINPATGNPNPEVPVSTAEDVDAAVTAAKAAFKTWSRVSQKGRKEALIAFAGGLKSYSEQFIKLLIQEQGKPRALASMEVFGAVSLIEDMSDFELKSEIVEDTEDRTVIVRYTPLGVAIGIVPWNFPIMTAATKFIPAILTGNTMIIKSSPFTPYCALKLAEVAQQFLPPGVLQALSGDDSLGPMLTAHPIPAKISFTGSSATGKKVMETASKTLKRVTLELGGNDPAIICDDVDVETVAQKISLLAFGNSGQICIAIKRIFVHESIYERFRDAMVRTVAAFKMGEGNEDGVSIGPVQNSMQFEKVKSLFSDIEKEKWTVASGGSYGLGRSGYFMEPTIIDNPPLDSRIVVEEPFGPIVPLVVWSDENQVIQEANNTKLGLGASVWSKDLERATRIGAQLEAGSIWINSHLEPSVHAPFGGHKESGMGYEGGLGGLKSFCNAQSIYMKKSN